VSATPSETAVTVMRRLSEAGVRLAPDGPNLRIWSPTPLTPELRELIAEHKRELLEYLAIWSQKRAIALGFEADVLVEKLGVSGTDPEIQGAADRYMTALESEDMGGIRLACFALEMRARFLAAQRQARPKRERPARCPSVLKPPRTRQVLPGAKKSQAAPTAYPTGRLQPSDTRK
jgi:hypothetical protein